MTDQWSASQLTEYFATISGSDEENVVVQLAVERAAEVLDAEIAAVVVDGTVRAAWGLGAGGAGGELLSTLAGIRGYGSYYPELPCVSAAMSESLQKWPAAAAVLDRDEKITAKVMETLEDDDFDRKRAYVFHRSVAETEDATNVEDGTDGSSPARETMFCYIVE